ncbi:MAG: hypothetical protein V1782_06310, partial [Pseudomonadota bacterium]
VTGTMFCLPPQNLLGFAGLNPNHYHSRYSFMLTAKTVATGSLAHKIIFAITHQIKVQCGIKKDSLSKLMG